MVKFSIIVPFYNAEKYILNCVDYLIQQTYGNFEAIFVDDGSTDDSVRLFNTVDDARFVLLQQKKSGVSAARNLGLKHCHGDLICFMDVDDGCKNNFLEVFATHYVADAFDICFCDYYNVYPNHIEVSSFDLPQVMRGEEVISHILPKIMSISGKQSTNFASVWRMCVSSHFYKTNTVLFDTNIAIAEDFLFILELLHYAQVVCYENLPLYLYSRNPSSALNKFVENKIEKELYLHEKIMLALKKDGAFKKYYANYQYFRFRMYTAIVSNACRNPNVTDEKKELKKAAQLFRNDEILYHIKVSFLERLFSLLMKTNNTFLLRVLFKIKEKIRINKLKRIK